MNKVFLFVYGSLKKGFINEHVLKKCSLIIDSCKTDGEYEMYPCMNYLYPYLYDTNREIGMRIEGELYEVEENILKGELDIFEGTNDGLYERKTIKVILPNGEKINAEAYITMPTNANIADTEMEHPLREWEQKHNKCGIICYNYIEKLKEEGWYENGRFRKKSKKVWDIAQ